MGGNSGWLTVVQREGWAKDKCMPVSTQFIGKVTKDKVPVDDICSVVTTSCATFWRLELTQLMLCSWQCLLTSMEKDIPKLAHVNYIT